MTLLLLLPALVAPVISASAAFGPAASLSCVALLSVAVVPSAAAAAVLLAMPVVSICPGSYVPGYPNPPAPLTSWPAAAAASSSSGDVPAGAAAAVRLLADLSSFLLADLALITTSPSLLAIATTDTAAQRRRMA